MEKHFFVLELSFLTTKKHFFATKLVYCQRKNPEPLHQKLISRQKNIYLRRKNIFPSHKNIYLPRKNVFPRQNNIEKCRPKLRKPHPDPTINVKPIPLNQKSRPRSATGDNCSLPTVPGRMTETEFPSPARQSARPATPHLSRNRSDFFLCVTYQNQLLGDPLLSVTLQKQRVKPSLLHQQKK